MEVRIIFSLAFIVLLLFFLFLSLIHLKKRNGSFFNLKGNIEEIERFYYSHKSYLSIVKIQNEIILLGITEGNINFLKSIDDKETLDKLLLENSSKNKGANFSDFLSINGSNFESLKNRLSSFYKNEGYADGELLYNST